jgi:hypothetical protein
MAWNLILLKNVTPRETQKILSLTMVIIYSWLFVWSFYVWLYWKSCRLCYLFSDEQFPSEEDEALAVGEDGLVPDDSLVEDDSLVPYASDTQELSLFHESGAEEEEEPIRADLGGGWGRIIYSPIRRGKQVQMDVCRSTKRDASEGAFERVIVTQRKNPALHLQARKSLWGDLWPFWATDSSSLVVAIGAPNLFSTGLGRWKWKVMSVLTFASLVFFLERFCLVRIFICNRASQQTSRYQGCARILRLELCSMATLFNNVTHHCIIITVSSQDIITFCLYA